MARYIVRRRSSAPRLSAERVTPRPFDVVTSELSGSAFLKTDTGVFAQVNDLAGRDSETATMMSGRTTLFVEGDARKLEKLRDEKGPDILVEPVIEYRKADAPFDHFHAGPLDLTDMLRSDPMGPAAAGGERTLVVRVLGRRGDGHANLAHAEVHVFLGASGGVRQRLRLRTEDNGEARFSLARWLRVLTVVAYPYSGYAPTVRRGDFTGTVKLLCDRLKRSGDTPTAWWHDAVGARGDLPAGVASIRVGVIDSGCGPHPALRHVENVGSFIEGVIDPGGGDDSGSHGTHVCGTIGARVDGLDVPFRGVAPDVDLVSARVFPESGGANQGDIADALDTLVGREVDLVNMSLGADQRSEVLSDAIRAAYDTGTVCLCASGNDAGPVSYPAANEEALAVAAMGRLGKVPADSFPAIPNDPKLIGSLGYHAADFTNHGQEVRMTAPGVGIVAPVPQRFGFAEPYAMMNGTSMACPVATGAMALMLAKSPDYGTMPRNRDRSRFVGNLASAACRSVELPAAYEGCGLPNAQVKWIS